MAEKYLDIEHGIIYTKNDLFAEYETMKENGELEEYDNFGQYLNACLDKNGVLEKFEKGAKNNVVQCKSSIRR